MWVSKKAISLTEILVVVAIIAILSGLLTPVVLSAKKQAQETTCISNLKQIWVALSLYREDHGSIDSPAESGQMGFPFSIHVAVDGPDAQTKPPSEVFQCRGRMLYSEEHYGTYAQLWPPPYGPFYSAAAQVEWKEFVTRLSDLTPVLADWSHQRTTDSTPWSSRRAMAMTLGGTFVRRNNRGEPSRYSWW